MVRYHNFDVVFAEIPGETTLALNITGCPNRCPGCHSPHLQADEGRVLDEAELLGLLASCREDEAAVDALQCAVEQEGGLLEASKVMHGYLRRAAALLAEWPDSPFRSALVDLCAYVAERNR